MPARSKLPSSAWGGTTNDHAPPHDCRSCCRLARRARCCCGRRLRRPGSPTATCRPPRWRRLKAFQEIIARVAKETNNGFEIKYHLGGSLSIKVTDITTAVGDNVIQLGDDGFQQGNVPITGIPRLRHAGRTQYQQFFEKALAIMKPYIDKAYDKKGVDGAVDLLFPGADRLVEQEAHLARRLQGPEIRATSPEQIEFLKRFGANGLTVGAPKCRRRWSAAWSTAC